MPRRRHWGLRVQEPGKADNPEVPAGTGEPADTEVRAEEPAGELPEEQVEVLPGEQAEVRAEMLLQQLPVPGDNRKRHRPGSEIRNTYKKP